MKRAASILFSCLVAFALTLYGPLGMAEASSNGTFLEMEICADGVAETVLVGFDGTPIEPSHDCHQCCVCCDTFAGHPNLANGVGLPFCLSVAAAEPSSFQTPFLHTSNIRPMPRGPPVMHKTVQNTPVPIHVDQVLYGHKTRCDGRPLFKDANA
ncbi:hypothetical protein TG4357_00455 [Thalassovita gelatinovora]|uniref:DUF2946 domain-containing protein n=1 Tax=Thalassovita gelatinovora TaxID=53501 RepID=A0A0P1F5E4_THAGE|nr:DUF2946 family protein [Thalassovita gelatinovora]QIZ79573.1 hypothetical protein HFZ77_03310 [Thalassovita gelatinovora]CUH63056.1 hypothetical protein TG4357_00455 [Thalassovita gelatinovora]SEQ14969.1 hypothetical protein SAMN04488043_103355 [Thalassovita gelatinovora]